MAKLKAPGAKNRSKSEEANSLPMMLESKESVTYRTDCSLFICELTHIHAHKHTQIAAVNACLCSEYISHNNYVWLMPDARFLTKMQQIQFRLGLRPRPAGGAHSAPQIP